MAVLFSLGRTYATPAALDVLGAAGVTAEELLRRHAGGDWGNLCPEDRQLNEQALLDGSRVFSAYVLAGGVKVWVITEAAVAAPASCCQTSTRPRSLPWVSRVARKAGSEQIKNKNCKILSRKHL